MAKKTAKSAAPKTAKKAAKPAPKPASKSAKPAKPAKAPAKVAAKGKTPAPAPAKAKVSEKAPAKANGKAAAAPAAPVPKPAPAAAAKAPAAKANGKTHLAVVPAPAGKAAKAPKSEAPAPQIMSGAPDSEPEVVANEAAGQDKAAPEKKKRKDDLKIDRNGDLEGQWQSLFEKSKQLKPMPYKMSDNYEARTPLMHKVLGWGYVITSQNNRLEVLFKDGIKILIANYKP